MEIISETLDDLLNTTLKELIRRPFNISSSRTVKNGQTSEIICASLCLTNPRARLSLTETKGKAFSAIGELFWYLSKSNSLDFIKYYIPKYEEESEDGISIHGGYGPRLFNLRGIDQIENIIKLLRSKPSSRRAVIQIFDAEDLTKNFTEIPCTCTLQFLIRDQKLNLITNMRSNDAFVGLPHDIFTFTMLQEIIAKDLSLELGNYYHTSGSLHLYENDKKKAEQYLAEGFQSTKIIMPSMPAEPWKAIQILLFLESKIRKGEEVDLNDFSLPEYWSDIAYLLKIHSLFLQRDKNAILILMKNLSTNVFDIYIKNRLSNIKGDK